MTHPGFFDFFERQKKLLKTRDFLERINAIVKWKAFRPVQETALKRSDRKKGATI